ncbi:MAG TPA: cytochrome ubiquinol oxidase subunit I [Burkholderiaceae bacterium]|nr:cytochrome ubiquinol oxidase subunit I [bacterium SGD-2]HZH57873.1 cytochrome ubiquinol oxidase subunit I [Burkholderiaceae bacterium]
MSYSALWLSQAQFFISLSFLLLFLLLEIGLAWALVVFKLRGQWGDPRGTQAYRFWVRVFALAFVLSFAAAVPVMVQLGSLWPLLMERIGDVAGPLLAAAVFTVFLFRACFVGAMLFGQRRLSDRAHTVLVALVALGVTLSALWPMALFSWMRTPAGAFFSNGQYVVTEWSRVILNPSFPWYAALLFTLALAASCLFMLGVSALQSLRRALPDADRMVFNGAARAAVFFLLVLGALAVQAGRELAEHEPARAAAAAGYWQSGPEPSFSLFSIRDPATGGDRWAWRWPQLGGAFLARDAAGYRGLDQFSGMDPPWGLTFWSLRLGALALLLCLVLAALAWWRLHAHDGNPGLLPVWLRRALVAGGFGGWLIALAGFGHVFIGAYPYAVAGTVTYSEVLAETPVAVLVAGGLGLLTAYALCIAGFMRLLWHIVRYGVVPVARRRGRA